MADKHGEPPFSAQGWRMKASEGPMWRWERRGAWSLLDWLPWWSRCRWCCCCWRDEAATWTDLFNRTLQRLDLTRAHDHHRRRGSWPDVLWEQVNLPSRRTRRPGEISM